MLALFVVTCTFISFFINCTSANSQEDLYDSFGFDLASSVGCDYWSKTGGINPRNAADHWSFTPLSIANLSHPFFVVQITIASICGLFLIIAGCKEKKILKSILKDATPSEDAGTVSTHLETTNDEDSSKTNAGDDEEANSASGFGSNGEMGPVALTSFLFTSLSIMGGVNLREYEEPGPYDRIGASLTETAKEMLQGSFDVSVEKSDVLKTVEDDEGSSGNTCTWVLYRTKFSGKEVGGLSQNDMKQIISDCWEESIQDGTLLSELRQIESDIIKVCTGREELEVEVVEELEGNRGENPLPTFSTSINAISTTSCGGDDTESNKVDETLDDARLRQWQIRIALAQFCSMVVTIFAVMVGRLVVLWNIAPHYTPAINSASGRLVYVNLAAYFADRPSDYELEELGCHELISPVTFEEVPVDY